MFKTNKKNQDCFAEWLSTQVSPAQLSELYMMYDKINKFFIQRGMLKISIMETTDIKIVDRILKAVEQNKVFRIMHRRERNRIVAAVRYYYNYLKVQENVESNDFSEQNYNVPKTKNIQAIGNQKIYNDENIDLKSYNYILQKMFTKGFRLESVIEIRKFKKYWSIVNAEDIEFKNEEIEQNMKRCGVVYDGRVYAVSSMISDELKTKLFLYINSCFEQGVSALYFDALFNEFSDDFLGYCMYNAEMLKAYLSFVNKGQYCINDSFISKDKNAVVDPIIEVRKCLIDAAIPMTCGELYDKLSHIPTQKIKQILNSNPDFICNGRTTYFHIDITVLTEDYLNDISSIIADAIAEKKFISGNELIESISNKCPYIIESNSIISKLGLRNAIGYKLKTKFSFTGNIVSSKDEQLSMMDVFAEFCKQRKSFTLDELKMLKQELNTTIYFEAVYENSLRISRFNFVSKDQAHFDVAATDLAIDRFCTGDYISISKIEQFGSFPDAGFQWNDYLLEHYVAIYSVNYKLIHCTFNETACVGGIVKKSSYIETFDELVADALSNSHTDLDKESALQFLCAEGYLARRNYSGIGEVLIKANELRNKKGN